MVGNSNFALLHLAKIVPKFNSTERNQIQISCNGGQDTP